MYDMLISEDDKDPNFKERQKRYKWVTIGKNPYIAQIVTNNDYDVTWKWGEQFQLRIYKGWNLLFDAIIPNWEMAEIEDVADELILALSKQE